MSRRPSLLLVVLITVHASIAASAGEASRKANPRLGINLAGPDDASTELPFVNVFHFSRGWISQKPDTSWGHGPRLELDARGWVKRLSPGCWAETILCNIPGGHYPRGEYTVLYTGRGTIEFGGSAEVTSSQPGRMTIEVEPKKGMIALKLVATDPDDPVRNIRVVMPGHEPTYQSDPWNPAFLRLWSGMACLRFMDMMRTNNSAVVSWSDRPRLDDATFTASGVPAELLIDLANRLKVAPWFCMPHRADDEYVRNFARLVAERLDPTLKAFVEYSNEVWNTVFAQHAYAAEQGTRMGFAEKPWEAAWRFTAFRSSQIFAVWEEALGGRDRLVRVLASQASTSHIAEEILGFRAASQHADALAIAPYLSMNLSPESQPSSSEVGGWSTDQVLDYLENKSLPESVRWMEENKKIAEKFGMKLIAYEAGQHMVGVLGGENNEALTAVVHVANASPRIGEIYLRYLDAWNRVGGDLICHYTSVGPWSKWGSWSLLRHLEEDPSDAPKFVAATRWTQSLGQCVAIPVNDVATPPRLEAGRSGPIPFK